MTNRPKRVIAHCAATPDSRESKFNVGHIRQWHVEENKWSDIGYHRYIDRVGIIHLGRDDNIIGAGVKGHNKDTLHLCYEGTYFPTVVQIKSLIYLYRTFRDIYRIEHTSWFGHHEFNSSKECPGFCGQDFRDILSMIA